MNDADDSVRLARDSDLIHQARLRRALLANVRQELLTPAEAILAYGRLLLDAPTNLLSETARDDVVAMVDAGQRLRDRIAETLDGSAHDDDRNEDEWKKLQSRVRHDLMNALNQVMGLCELLIDDAPPNFGAPPELHRILSACQQVLSIADRILTFPQASEPTPAPAVAAALSAIRPVADLGASSPCADRGRFLIVDDNPINRDVLARQLERDGHIVGVAEDGQAALAALRSAPYDIVLLDIIMPVLTGYEVLEVMKEDPSLCDIPVIMVSALDEFDILVRCVERGAEDYLTKPFNRIQLNARISACLEKKRLRDQQARHLAQLEAERRRIDELLHVLLPHPVVAELKEKNHVPPRRYEKVAVLFADIVGFTSYCDRHEPEHVVPVLQRLFEAWEEIAFQEPVEKIKTIGDAFMVAAGLLVPLENPVLQCLRCGQRMIAAAGAVTDGWNVRVGIHVGPVVAGVIGRRQYLFDLWGDTVNTAARLESIGSPGTITLSSAAWREVAATCDGESLGVVAVKGKGRLEAVRFTQFRSAAAA